MRSVIPLKPFSATRAEGFSFSSGLVTLLPMDSLFVYGTLQDPAVQTRVFGRVAVWQPDALDGYRKGEIKIGGNVYWIAIEDRAGAIIGQVLEVSTAELVKIDQYEGDDYRRVHVRLRSGREGWVYCV